MKTTNRLVTMAAIAALTVGTASRMRADDLQGKPKLGNPDAPLSTDVNKDKDTTRYTSENRSERKTGVSDVHKASSIVGMKVKNHADETLGNIEDLVLDLKSGQISYAVLGVGGFLGIGEKYIAVPPSAFSVGLDEKTLMLNADKAKLQSAPGFAKTNWPDYRNPNFGGAGFWETEAVGGTSTSSSTDVIRGTDKSSSEGLKLDKKPDYKSDQDLNRNNPDRINK